MPEYSGRLVLRLPVTLHARLAEQAEHDRISLNQHMVRLLAVASTVHESEAARSLKAALKADAKMAFEEQGRGVVPGRLVRRRRGR
jgi:hypothetical protein